MKLSQVLLTVAFTAIFLYLSAINVHGYHEPTIGQCSIKYDKLCKEQHNSCCKWSPPGTRYFIEQCFNYRKYSCIKDISTEKAVLCPKGEKACNGQCFDTEKYNCAKNEEASRYKPKYQLCPSHAPSACDGACYNPYKLNCCPGGYYKGGFLFDRECPTKY